GIRDLIVTGVQTCALPISHGDHDDDPCPMRPHGVPSLSLPPSVTSFADVTRLCPGACASQIENGGCASRVTFAQGCPTSSRARSNGWSGASTRRACSSRGPSPTMPTRRRSEEHTSELQSRSDLVCRLL